MITYAICCAFVFGARIAVIASIRSAWLSTARLWHMVTSYFRITDVCCTPISVITTIDIRLLVYHNPVMVIFFAYQSSLRSEVTHPRSESQYSMVHLSPSSQFLSEYEHPPVELLQESMVHSSPSSHRYLSWIHPFSGWQPSLVQASLSSQITSGNMQLPLRSQRSLVQRLPSSQLGVKTQPLSLSHVSFVHAFPSLQMTLVYTHPLSS